MLVEKETECQLATTSSCSRNCNHLSEVVHVQNLDPNATCGSNSPNSHWDGGCQLKLGEHTYNYYSLSDQYKYQKSSLIAFHILLKLLSEEGSTTWADRNESTTTHSSK